MYKKLSKNKQKGFTLIEIMISAFIIAMLTGIFLANYHSANQRSVLNIFIQEMTSDIRLMQSYALSSYEYEGAISDGGWGIYINNGNKNYTLFADTNNDQDYSGPSELFKIVNFPDGVIIDNIDADYGTTIGSVNITFVPPAPTIHIKELITNYDDVVIILKDEKNNISRNIEVNYFGLIDVQRN